MKLIKRISLGLLIFLILSIVLLLAAPVLFKDEILTFVKKELNQQLDADTDFEDVNVSLIKSFPKLSAEIENLSITGRDSFSGQNLAEIGNLRFVLDLSSVINKEQDPKIEQIIVDDAKIDLLILADGRANYDIYKSTAEATDTAQEGLSLELSKVVVNRSSLSYTDRSVDQALSLQDINASSKIKIQNQLYLTDNVLSVENVDFSMSGVSYLKDAVIEASSGLDIDLNSLLIRLRENDISLNALRLKADGTMDINDDHQVYDIRFSAPGDEFKQFLSLLPSAYTDDFDQVRSSGSLALEGFVKGKYSDKEVPAFEVNLDVKEGQFQYPGFAQDIRNIFAKAKISSQENLKSLAVISENLSLSIDGDPLATQFELRGLLDNPSAKGSAKGKLDLSKLKSAYPMQDIKELSGVLDLDVAFDLDQSSIIDKRWDDVLADGNITSDQIILKYASYPTITVDQLDVEIDPKIISVKSKSIGTQGSVGRADILVSDYLLYTYDQGDLDVKVNAELNKLNVPEWLVTDDTGSESPSDSAMSASGASLADGINVDLDAKIDIIEYPAYDIRDVVMIGSFSDDDLTIKNGALKINESDLRVNGQLTDLLAYYYDAEVLGGTLNLRSELLNINKLMPSSAESSTTRDEDSLSVIAIPANIELEVNPRIDRLIYGDYDLRNTTGEVLVQDQTVFLDQVESTTMGGKMNFAGSYETPDEGPASFRMKYDMSDINFNKFFNTVNTFDLLLPVGKFIEGVFNSSLVLEGDLKDNLFPDLNSLTGRGFLETLDGTIQRTELLSKIADKLQVDRLKDLAIENTTNWLEVKNGMVEVKKFDKSIEGIDFTIGGTHSLTQELNYKVIARIPREMMDKNVVGQSVNKGIDFITKEASSRGLNLESGSHYLVQIDVTGSILKPDLKYTVLGTEDKDIKSFVDEKGEEIKEKIVDTVTQTIDTLKEEIRSQAEEKVEEIKDTVKTIVEEKVDTIVEQVKDTVTSVVEEKVSEKAKEVIDKELKDKTEDIFGEEAKEETEKIKESIKDWNPFKKKKKKDGGGIF